MFGCQHPCCMHPYRCCEHSRTSMPQLMKEIRMMKFNLPACIGLTMTSAGLCCTFLCSSSVTTAAEPFYSSPAAPAQNERSLSPRLDDQFGPSLHGPRIRQDQPLQYSTQQQFRPANVGYGSDGAFVGGRCSNGECRRNPDGQNRSPDMLSQRNQNLNERRLSDRGRYQSRSATTPSRYSTDSRGYSLTSQPSNNFGSDRQPDTRCRCADGNCPNCINGQCNCRNGQCDCPSGQCQCANGNCPNCVNGQCNCRDGQCDCPNGQCRCRGREMQRVPVNSNDLLTRGNSYAPQYRPTAIQYRY